MNETEELMALVPEGMFANASELQSFIDQQGMRGVYDLIPSGMFADVTELEQAFGSKKKEPSDSEVMPSLSPEEVAAGVQEAVGAVPFGAEPSPFAPDDPYGYTQETAVPDERKLVREVDTDFKPIADTESTRVDIKGPGEKIEEPEPEQDQFFEMSMAAVTPDLIDAPDDRDTAKELNYQFGRYGFEFTTTPLDFHDQVTVKAANGNEITVNLDPLLDIGKEEQTEKLRDFLRKNKMQSEALTRAEEGYKEARMQFGTREQIDQEVTRINTAENDFRKLVNSYAARKDAIEQKHAGLLKYTQEYLDANPDEFEAYKAAFKMYQDDMATLEEDRIKLMGMGDDLEYQVEELNRAAGEFVKLKAEQSTVLGFSREALSRGTAGMFGEPVSQLIDIVSQVMPLGSGRGYEQRFIDIAQGMGLVGIPEALTTEAPEGARPGDEAYTQWLNTYRKTYDDWYDSLPEQLVDEVRDEMRDQMAKGLKYNPEMGGMVDAAYEGVYRTLGDRKFNEEAYVKAQESFLGRTALSLLESVPAFIGRPGGSAAMKAASRFARMENQVAGQVDREFRADPELAKVSEEEKLVLKKGIGIVVGALEQFGFRNALGRSGVVNSILMRAINKAPVGVKGKAFRDLVQQEIKSAAARGLIATGTAALGEAETEFVQTYAEVGAKDVYNAMKGKEMFKAADTFSKETFFQAMEAAASGAIGGAVLGVPGSIAAASTTYDFTKLDDATMATFEFLANPGNRGASKQMFVADLKNKVNRGELTGQQAKEAEANYEKVVQAYDGMREVEGMTMEEKKQVLGLEVRRQELLRRKEATAAPFQGRIDREISDLNLKIQDALQEREAAPVDVGERARAGERVDEEVREEEAVITPEAEEEVIPEAAAATNQDRRAYDGGTLEAPRLEQLLSGVADKLRSKGRMTAFQSRLLTENRERVDTLVELKERAEAEALREEAALDETIETLAPNVESRRVTTEALSPIQERVVSRAQAAAKAVSQVAPNVKFVLHETTAQYNRATGFTGGGVFTDGTVHINLERANNRTVAHETLHAIMLSADGMTLPVVQQVTKRMATSLSKSLDKGSELKKRLDKFIAQYDENVRDEEKVAELFGYMADGYANLEAPQKSLIRRYVEKIAETFGVNLPSGWGQQDQDVVDFLNTVSRKVAAGEVITEEEVAVTRATREEQRAKTDENLRAAEQRVDDLETIIGKSVEFAEESTFDNKIEFKRALQERFNQLVLPELEARYGITDSSELNENLKEYLVDAYMNETLNAIAAYPDALGWYDSRITGAMSLMSLLHPELATDPDAASAFKIALAITSNGNKVYDNFVEANRQYKYYKENGRFDESRSIGNQVGGILSNLKFANEALGVMSMAELTQFLTTKHKVGSLSYRDSAGKKKNLISGFGVNEEVYGAAVFGPKIGNGFFMNLYGVFDQLTMDRWFMRQYGRLTGTLLDFDQKKVDAATKRLARARKALLQRNSAKVEGLIGSFENLSDAELAQKVQKASVDIKKRAVLKSNPKLDEFRKASNNLAKLLEAEVEAPTPAKRRFINEVFSELQQKLKDENGIDITIADLQAVNWYPEKALYQTFKADQTQKSAKTETSDNEQPDYESAARKLVEKEGITQQQIDGRQIERDDTAREADQQRAAELLEDDEATSQLRDRILSIREEVTTDDLKAREQRVSDVVERYKFRPDGSLIGDSRLAAELGRNLARYGYGVEQFGDRMDRFFIVDADGRRVDPKKLIAEDRADEREEMQMRAEERATQEARELEEREQELFETEVAPFLETIFPESDLPAREQKDDLDKSGPTELDRLVAYAKERGYSNAAILLARPEAQPAIDAYEEAEKRMLKELNGVIKKTRARVDATEERVLESALGYLQGSKFYADATDVGRELMVRGLREKLGVREKRAPAAKRIVSGPVERVTLTVREALNNQLKSEARGARAAAAASKAVLKQMAADITELQREGKITAKQAATVIRRFASVNVFNPVAVNNFLDYMAKVFADAEYANDMARLRKMRPTARKNVKRKLGRQPELISDILTVLAIDPTRIPVDTLPQYRNLLNIMSKRRAVLELPDIQDLVSDVKSILDAVNEEQSLADELADIFEAFDAKVLTKTGGINFNETLKAMVAAEVITDADATLMRKYKSDIVDTSRAEKTEEQLEVEAEEMRSIIRGSELSTNRLGTRLDRDAARKFENLLKTEAVNELNNRQLENLLRVIDNINNGYLTHSAQLAIERMEAKNRARSLNEALEGAKLNTIREIGGALTNVKDARLGAIVRNPLELIDQVFGNFKTTPIYDATFRPIAEAAAAMMTEKGKIGERLTKAQIAVAKSHKRNPNDIVRSKYLMTTYLLQLEHESNPGNKQTPSAMAFLDATINAAEDGTTTKYNAADIGILKGIKDKYTKGKEIDAEAIYSDFNTAERNALKTVQEINLELTPKAEFASSVIRGAAIEPILNYLHHSVLPDESLRTQKTDALRLSEAYNQRMRPSTRAKTFVDRTAGAKPIEFDIMATVNRGANQTLTDFYLTEPIRTARKALNETETENKEVLRSITNAVDGAVRNALERSVTTSNLAEKALDLVAKQGYRTMLASIPRFASELISNLSYVALADPAAFEQGIKYRDYFGVDGADIMTNVGSAQTKRVYPSERLSGRMVDTSIMSGHMGSTGSRAGRESLNSLGQMLNYAQEYPNAVALVADGLISTPDKLIMRPLWFGAFAKAFKAETGRDVDYDAIARNDEAYMTEFSEAIEAAKREADRVSAQAGATDNPFMGIQKGKSKGEMKPLMQTLRIANNFMSRFIIYEFTAARTGIQAAVGNGTITQEQGVRLFAAVLARMTMYSLLTPILSDMFVSLFTDVPEEDEDPNQLFARAFLSGATTMASGVMGQLGRIPVNYGIEAINERYFDFLRDGEYDPYDDYLQFNNVPDFKRGTDFADFMFPLMGAGAPMARTAELGLKTIGREGKKRATRERYAREQTQRLPLEVLGNLGLIPFYRDVRKVLITDMYSDLDKKKKSGVMAN